MLPFSHDPFDPLDPLDPSEGLSPRDMARRRFCEAIAPFWRTLHLALSRQQPSDWTGYRCEIEVGLARASGRYVVMASFRDGLGNRSKKLESRSILELVGCLHESYRRFDEALEWHKVSLSRLYDESEQRWCDRTGWEYGQLVVEGETGEGGLN